jgi:integrase
VAARTRKRAERYRNGDCTLGWRGGWAVADYRDAGTSKRQRVRLGKFRKNSQEARDALDAFADKRKLLSGHGKRYTVGQLWQLWLEAREKDGFDNAIYEAQWVSLKKVFANRVPYLLTDDDFRDYARQRFDLGRSQWTVYNELVRIRSCLKWAVGQRRGGQPLLRADELPKVWTPQRGRHRERVLSLDEARALVAASSEGDPHIHVFVVVAFATSARHTAILDLTWPRVDFVGARIGFDENIPPDPMNKSWRKGRATVPMNRGVRRVLELAHRGRRSEYVVEHGGGRLKTVRSGFYNAVKRAAEVCPSLGRWEERKGKKVFVTDVTPHTIRHTVLTWLEEGKVPTGRRAQLAGHKDEATTRLVYSHASPEVLREAVGILDDAFDALTHLEVQPTSEGVEIERDDDFLSQSGQGEEKGAKCSDEPTY